MNKCTIALLIITVFVSQSNAYQISIKNELDGPISVIITENKIITPRSVRAGDTFEYRTEGCYVLTLKADSGKAVGQMGGVGNDFQPACKDYKVIARFLQEPVWDPVTGKTSLIPAIMELREE